MIVRRSFLPLLLCITSLAGTGCSNAPGKPGPEPEVPRPDQVVDFKTLYGQNCVACHGDNRQPGPAIALSNPVYLALAGESNIRNAVANGVPGRLMPAFGRSAGGMLTDEQVSILASGLIREWGKPGALVGATPPSYKATLHADAAAGEKAFLMNCGSCHGAKGDGVLTGTLGRGPGPGGSIVAPSFLALISDQNLRSFAIAGVPTRMPDWRSHEGDQPLTDQEITDIVAWLASHRETQPTAAQSPMPASNPKAATAKLTHETSSTR